MMLLYAESSVKELNRVLGTIMQPHIRFSETHGSESTLYIPTSFAMPYTAQLLLGPALCCERIHSRQTFAHRRYPFGLYLKEVNLFLCGISLPRSTLSIVYTAPVEIIPTVSLLGCVADISMRF